MPSIVAVHVEVFHITIDHLTRMEDEQLVFIDVEDDQVADGFVVERNGDVAVVQRVNGIARDS